MHCKADNWKNNHFSSSILSPFRVYFKSKNSKMLPAFDGMALHFVVKSGKTESSSTEREKR